MSLPTKRCGRPPVLSFLEKKKRKQSLDRRRGKTRIYVGNHIDRWLTLKEKLDFRNDAEVAGFLLDLYDSYDPLAKAPVCSLPEGVRRSTVKEERSLSDNTSLIAADGTYDNDDQLSKESACSGPEDVRIVTVKEEREMPHDCLSAETDDTRWTCWGSERNSVPQKNPWKLGQETVNTSADEANVFKCILQNSVFLWQYNLSLECSNNYLPGTDLIQDDQQEENQALA